jgi:hypothetical protein
MLEKHYEFSIKGIKEKYRGLENFIYERRYKYRCIKMCNIHKDGTTICIDLFADRDTNNNYKLFIRIIDRHIDTISLKWPYTEEKFKEIC